VSNLSRIEDWTSIDKFLSVKADKFSTITESNEIEFNSSDQDIINKNRE